MTRTSLMSIQLTKRAKKKVPFGHFTVFSRSSAEQHECRGGDASAHHRGGGTCRKKRSTTAAPSSSSIIIITITK
jgi:hypothetical protein